MATNAPIPVVLFTYARPQHLARVLECLRKEEPPLLYVFADGARDRHDIGGVAETRSLLRDITWTELRLTERQTNFGLGRNVLAGVSDVAARHDAFIVYEDDLICVPGTYNWLCTALHHYHSDDRVMSVTAWNHPRVTPRDIIDKPYFDGRAECWVWGAWARSWRGMRAEDALTKMKLAEERGVPRASYGRNLPRMAEQERRKNIWAVRWLYHHLEHGGLCVRPPWSMVEHIGFDAAATNAAAAQAWANPPLRTAPPIPSNWPEAVEYPECKSLWRTHQPREPLVTRAKAALGDWLDTGVREPLSKRIAKKIIPGRLRATLRRVFGWKWFQGDFESWAAARATCGGYDGDEIVNKVLAATLAVREGLADFERDGVTFQGPQPEQGLIAALSRVAIGTGGTLRVLDFGGALGTSFWRHWDALGDISLQCWDVVEQASFVAAGRRHLEQGPLRFFDSVKAAEEKCSHDVLLASTSLQYLDDPSREIRSWIDHGWQWLLLNNLPLHERGADRIAVQRVPAAIYSASYPVWFFNREQFLAQFARRYEVISEFRSEAVWPVGWREYPSTGLLFRRIEHNHAPVDSPLR